MMLLSDLGYWIVPVGLLFLYLAVAVWFGPGAYKTVVDDVAQHRFEAYGPCQHQGCNYHSPRCEWGYCRVCCGKYHVDDQVAKGGTRKHIRAIGAIGFYVNHKVIDHTTTVREPGKLLALPAKVEEKIEEKQPVQGTMVRLTEDTWSAFD